MDREISPGEKSRQNIRDYLRKEDIDEVKVRSKTITASFRRRKKSTNDPWLDCFYFSENKQNELPDKSPFRFTSCKNLKTDQIADMITNCPGITDEEMNYCKAALRREARSKKLPDLSSQPEELQKLFLKHRTKFNENLTRLRILSEEIEHNMISFKSSLIKGLEVLKPFSKIRITSDTTVDTATANITKMRSMVQEFQRHTSLVEKILYKVMEKIEKYQKIEAKMDRELFNFLAHFFDNFLIPRSVRKRKKE